MKGLGLPHYGEHTVLSFLRLDLVRLGMPVIVRTTLFLSMLVAVVVRILALLVPVIVRVLLRFVSVAVRVLPRLVPMAMLAVAVIGRAAGVAARCFVAVSVAVVVPVFVSVVRRALRVVT